MRRKEFLLSALILPIITSCSSQVEIMDTKSSIDTPLDDIFQSSIAENNSLIFGKLNNPRKLSLILNLGNSDTLTFLSEYLPFLKEKFNNDESFEILLVDLPSADPDLSSLSHLTSVISAVGMYSYVKSPELFLDYLQTVVERWNEQETFIREDIVYIAQELELLPNIDISGTNGITQEFIDNMTEKAQKIAQFAPSIIIDDTLWAGNVKNSIEVEQALNPPVQQR